MMYKVCNDVWNNRARREHAGVLSEFLLLSLSAPLLLSIVHVFRHLLALLQLHTQTLFKRVVVGGRESKPHFGNEV